MLEAGADLRRGDSIEPSGKSLYIVFANSS
jgi:hypothetical protein